MAHQNYANKGKAKVDQHKGNAPSLYLFHTTVQTVHCFWNTTGTMFKCSLVPRSLSYYNTISFAACFFCGYYLRVANYFLGKSTDINDGWIRFVQAIQWWLLDAVCSSSSLSVLLSVCGNEPYNMSSLSVSLVTVVRNYLHRCVCAACTSRGYYFKMAFILLRASNRAATIRGWCLFEEIEYVCFLVGRYIR